MDVKFLSRYIFIIRFFFFTIGLLNLKILFKRVVMVPAYE